MGLIEIIQTIDFEELRKNGLINETKLQDMKIRAEYIKRVKEQYPATKKKDIREQLANDLIISKDALNIILYSKKRIGKKFIK